MKRIHNDSAVILPTFEDKSFDLVIADPPYNFDDEQKLFFHTQMLRLSRGGVIVFSPPENQWVQPADQYLFWVKPISTKNTSKRYSRFVEMIFLYRTRWYTGRHWSQYTNVFNDLVDDTRAHAFRKPPSLIERLLHNHSKPGDRILDPFAGSFVIEETCKRLGRDCVSIEVENEEKDILDS